MKTLPKQVRAIDVMFLAIVGSPRRRDFLLTYVLKCIHVHHYLYTRDRK